MPAATFASAMRSCFSDAGQRVPVYFISSPWNTRPRAWGSWDGPRCVLPAAVQARCRGRGIAAVPQRQGSASTSECGGSAQEPCMRWLRPRLVARATFVPSPSRGHTAPSRIFPRSPHWSCWAMSTGLQRGLFCPDSRPVPSPGRGGSPALHPVREGPIHGRHHGLRSDPPFAPFMRVSRTLARQSVPSRCISEQVSQRLPPRPSTCA